MKRANPAFRDRFNLVALLSVVLLVALSLLAQANAQFYAEGDFYQRQTIWVVVGGAIFFGVELTTPFLSYDPTGLVTLLLGLGLVANVALHRAADRPTHASAATGAAA